jgi:hypothetical protein
VLAPPLLDMFAAEVRPQGADSVRVLPCRPTISCSADIVPPGTVEVEAGYAGRYVQPDGFVHTEPLLLKLTLLPWLQAQVGNNGYVTESGSIERALRYDDIWFSLKFHLLDQTSIAPSLALSASVSVPSFGPASDYPVAYDSSFWGYVSKDLGRVHLDLNGGANVWQMDRAVARTVQGFVTFATTVSLPLGFGAMGEVYGFSDAGPVAPEDAGALAAVSYSPRPSVMFDVGADAGAFPATRRMTLFLGVTFIPFRLWGGDRTLRPPGAAMARSQ